MTKTRRGGYAFVTWSGDHDPPHAHVYRDGRLVLRWNLETNTIIDGVASRRIVRIIEELRSKGLL